jgi:hypothetical protein
MLSKKNENYFRSNMKTLIQRFHNEKNKINHEKLNEITNCLCNSIHPERVFMEFASIFLNVKDEKEKDLLFVKDMIETLTFAIASSP